MAFKSEAEVWREERQKVARRMSARSRAFARWFIRLDDEPAEPDHFVWHSVADLLDPRS